MFVNEQYAQRKPFSFGIIILGEAVRAAKVLLLAIDPTEITKVTGLNLYRFYSKASV